MREVKIDEERGEYGHIGQDERICEADGCALAGERSEMLQVGEAWYCPAHGQQVTVESRPTLHIEIDCSNAAFGEDPGREAGRILRRLGQHYQRFGIQSERALIDANGNRVGVARFVTRGEE